MPAPADRRPSLLQEVRRTVVATSGACGLLAGVWYATEHPSVRRGCAPARGGHPGAALHRCAEAAASDVVWHWALVIGAASLAGLAAGVVLALMVPTAASTAHGVRR